ncbi:hypothetical protein BC829DRAFT_419180 [Chytridium lagenaria]|nr:hypothetical protein BC829DRAFT_419180 [Chytridium lagenaria]
MFCEAWRIKMVRAFIILVIHKYTVAVLLTKIIFKTASQVLSSSPSSKPCTKAATKFTPTNPSRQDHPAQHVPRLCYQVREVQIRLPLKDAIHKSAKVKPQKARCEEAYSLYHTMEQFEKRGKMQNAAVQVPIKTAAVVFATENGFGKRRKTRNSIAL